MARLKRRAPVGVLLLPLFLWQPGAHAQTAGTGKRVELQAFLGSSVSAPSPLTFTQAGQPSVEMTGHWATRPFQDTWYYAGRLGLWGDHRGWLLDFTHHKLYLTNPPSQVQRFQVTNGMNQITLSRGFRRKHLSYAIGAGPLVAFPKSRIRGRMLPSGRGFFGGYFLAGATLMASATRSFSLGWKLALLLDGRGSATYARLPIADGHATLLNFAAHVHVGLGWAP